MGVGLSTDVLLLTIIPDFDTLILRIWGRKEINDKYTGYIGKVQKIISACTGSLLVKELQIPLAIKKNMAWSTIVLVRKKIIVNVNVSIVIQFTMTFTMFTPKQVMPYILLAPNASHKLSL